MRLNIPRRKQSIVAQARARDGFSCCICGAWGNEVDHEIPLAVGGADSLENMRVLCKICHRAKTTSDAKLIAKTRRIIQKNEGTWRPRRRKPGIPGLKRKVDGTVVRRDD